MNKIAYLDDRRDLIRTMDADQVHDDLSCTFCGHAFQPGQKYVEDVEGFQACPGSCNGLSDNTCYSERGE